MVIRISRKNIGILLTYIIFTVPYIEVAAVRNVFEYAVGDVYIPAAVPIIAILYVFLWIANRTTRKWYGVQKQVLHGVSLKFLALSLFFLLGIVSHWSQLASYVCLLSFALPFFYAKEAVTYIYGHGLTTEDVVRHGTICFVLEQLAFLIINITTYGFSFSGDAETRIISVGGGPVILGYTVALVVALWLSYNKNSNKLVNIVVLALSVLIALATGSRGGMWPLLIIIFFYYASSKGKISSVKLIAVFIVVSILFFAIDFGALFPRLFDFTDGGRLTSVSNNLEVYGTNFDIIEKLFGKGLGNFYPIQKWMVDKSAGIFFNYNSFSFEGHSLLVQPHNSFVYSLMEGGILGLVLFVSVIVAVLKGSLKHSTSIENKLFVAVVLVIVFFESTFFVSPGSASLWWFILLVYATDEDRLMITGSV